ncbi:ABC transporter ATP-binding protein [Streptosporangium violaceochromogenes]|nr:ABC transporter ATP-binding protein [Streptosporangium violaceochromogenes]
MLRLDNVTAWYGRTQALFGVDLRVRRGETVALVGTNGAGKTTTLRAILGQVRTGGAVSVDERDITATATHRRVRDHGIAVVHEGRGLLAHLSILENLLVGATREQRRRLDDILTLFPVLADRLPQKVSLLSGGQQQMVALGRALLRDPSYLLLDEPALGLAPVVIDEIYGYVGDLCSRGMGVLLVEQSVTRAAQVADRLCLLRVGKVDRTVETGDDAAVNGLVADAFGVHTNL